MKLITKTILALIITCFIAFAFFRIPEITSASTTNGTVNSENKYAWCENSGWVNFGTELGDVRVTDIGLTGSVWTTNYGWVKLDPKTSGVKNDGSGNLTGFAWGNQLGWIDFDEVVINNDGIFTGRASGVNSGIITFDCDYCGVSTDWRPQNVRADLELAVATPESEEGIPGQLFDISLEIDDSTVESLSELSARVIFTSFGTEPTPIDLTFTIKNEAGEDLHQEQDSLVVETEAVFAKKFPNTSIGPGKYTLVLNTLYNVDVEDEFNADFEIIGKSVFSLRNILLLIAVIVAGTASILFFKKKKRKKGKKGDKEEKNVTRNL